MFYHSFNSLLWNPTALSSILPRKVCYDSSLKNADNFNMARELFFNTVSLLEKNYYWSGILRSRAHKEKKKCVKNKKKSRDCSFSGFSWESNGWIITTTPSLFFFYKMGSAVKIQLLRSLAIYSTYFLWAMQLKL